MNSTVRLLSCLLLLAALVVPTFNPAPAFSVPLELARTDHISIVQLGRRGASVILIPGLASPRAVWDGIAPQLARDHRVFLVQVNGFAGDDPGANAQAGLINGVVADLHAFVRRNRLRGAAVIGHSLGGLVGLRLAVEHPADVDRLMVVDSLPFLAILMAPPELSKDARTVEPFARQMRERLPTTFAKPQWTESSLQRLAFKPSSRAQVQRWALAANPQVVAQAYYEDIITDLRGQLGAIRAPVTLVYPWNPTLRMADRADAFYRHEFAAVPKITYVKIEDSAHFVMLDQPQAFGAAVDNFLR